MISAPLVLLTAHLVGEDQVAQLANLLRLQIFMN